MCVFGLKISKRKKKKNIIFMEIITLNSATQEQTMRRQNKQIEIQIFNLNHIC